MIWTWYYNIRPVPIILCHLQQVTKIFCDHWSTAILQTASVIPNFLHSIWWQEGKRKGVSQVYLFYAKLLVEYMERNNPFAPRLQSWTTFLLGGRCINQYGVCIIKAQALKLFYYNWYILGPVTKKLCSPLPKLSMLQYLFILFGCKQME
jgi:hypothetical protein